MKDAVGLFLAMGTQWRWVGVGMGGAIRTGMDYNALAATAESVGLKLPLTSQVFSDIRTLEQAAIDAWSRKR